MSPSYCEDYPCCGHASGECPDKDGTYRCVRYDKRLGRNSTSSLCAKCQRAYHRLMNRGDDYALDNF